ncbi:hypothetical protein [Flavobacterium sp. C4GT6]
MVTPAKAWHRKLFNGLAQVIVQTDGSGNDIILSAKDKGVKEEQL